jgi:hypothetical protein
VAAVRANGRGDARVDQRVPNSKTSWAQTSMQRPQLVQLAAAITGPAPPIPLSAGLITTGSGQTAKQ